MNISAAPRIIVALDYPDARGALALVDRIEPSLCRLKVGKELFTRAGPQLVEQLVARGFAVFLDLKFHDIPNTVASACHAAADLGVWMLNVHALGGARMLAAAREGVQRSGHDALLIAVTILTSMDTRDLAAVGLTGTPADNVQRLAALAQASGMDGVVCSSQEVMQLRTELGADFLLVTPGIRPAGSASDDQRRVMTPLAAMQAGSSYLVVGRPVTQADDPPGVLRLLNSELSAFS